MLFATGLGVILGLYGLNKPNPFGPYQTEILIFGLALMAAGVFTAGRAPFDWTVGLFRSIQRQSPRVSFTTPNSPGDTLLTITNTGPAGSFSAQGRLYSLRNSPNDFQRAPFPIPWQNSNAREAPIGRRAADNLLIASFTLGMVGDTRMGELTIHRWTQTAVGRVDGSRWIVNPNEKLPQYDLEISVFEQKHRKPVTRRYTLRPASFIGPLELVPPTS